MTQTPINYAAVTANFPFSTALPRRSTAPGTVGQAPGRVAECAEGVADEIALAIPMWDLENAVVEIQPVPVCGLLVVIEAQQPIHAATRVGDQLQLRRPGILRGNPAGEAVVEPITLVLTIPLS